MSIQQRRPGARWAVPAAAAAVVLGAGVVSGAAGASSGLDPRSAEQLLTDLQRPTTTQMSGTIQVDNDLGLPALPGATGSGSDFSALLSGARTVRVWYDGPTKARVSLLGRAGQSDVVRNGSDLWVWSSPDKTARHTRLDPAAKKNLPARPTPTDLPTTPQEVADRALAAIDDTTEVSTSGLARVAGRDAYELTLTPKTNGSLVQRVSLAIDGQTKVPLRGRVFSTRADAPAIDVGFSSVDFSAPDPSVFSFSPPPGTTVSEVDPPSGARGHGAGTTTPSGPAKSGANSKTRVVGAGWNQVMVATVGKDALNRLGSGMGGSAGSGAGADAGQTLSRALAALPPSSGPWGTGRAVEGTIFSIVLTDDGRLAVGAVPVERLHAALTTR